MLVYEAVLTRPRVIDLIGIEIKEACIRGRSGIYPRSSAASGDQRTSISALEQPFDGCAYFLMEDVLTSIERRQALLHRLDKTGLFGQRTAKDLACQIVRRAAFLGGEGGKLGFLFR
jgi:hypothetical protein